MCLHINSGHKNWTVNQVEPQASPIVVQEEEEED